MHNYFLHNFLCFSSIKKYLSNRANKKLLSQSKYDANVLFFMNLCEKLTVADPNKMRVIKYSAFNLDKTTYYSLSRQFVSGCNWFGVNRCVQYLYFRDQTNPKRTRWEIFQSHVHDTLINYKINSILIFNFPH